MRQQSATASPAICLNGGCDYTTEMEPDQDRGFCENLWHQYGSLGGHPGGHHLMGAEERRARIRELNDALRTTLNRIHAGGVMTAAVDTLPSDMKAMVIRPVATFSGFDVGSKGVIRNPPPTAEELLIASR